MDKRHDAPVDGGGAGLESERARKQGICPRRRCRLDVAADVVDAVAEKQGVGNDRRGIDVLESYH
jgi:hypothetical protein